MEISLPKAPTVSLHLQAQYASVSLCYIIHTKKHYTKQKKINLKNLFRFNFFFFFSISPFDASDEIELHLCVNDQSHDLSIGGKCSQPPN